MALVPQRPLGGQYRLVVQLDSSGNVGAYLIHHPHSPSMYGAALLGRYNLYVTDQELLDGDWQALLERALQAVIHGS